MSTDSEARVPIEPVVGLFCDDMTAAADRAREAMPPPMFAHGQRCRVLRRVASDGQTPEKWAGATASIEGRAIGGYLSPRYVYSVRHPDGSLCAFEEHELDRRFARR